MNTMINLAALAVATVLAAAAAFGLDWLLLRAAFVLMRPATPRQTVVRADLVRATRQLARAFAPHR
jgi:hypothetical protein